jgi:hypothetical protein
MGTLLLLRVLSLLHMLSSSCKSHRSRWCTHNIILSSSKSWTSQIFDSIFFWVFMLCSG